VLWPFVRNVFLLTNLLALLLYETYPMAPPRLTPGLTFEGQPYHFADTVFRQGPGSGLAFNEYSAMPSLHVAWALIIAGVLLWTARPWAVRLPALLYPAVVLLATVVTGNHYLVDGLGALMVVLTATALALAVGRVRRSLPARTDAQARSMTRQTGEPGYTAVPDRESDAA
jgi:membrane-associated phospholipid phosphatase